MRDPKGMLLTPEQRTQRAGRLLAIALALALVENGWEFRGESGQFLLRRGDQQLDPEQLINEIAVGKLTREAWAEQCRDASLTGLRLDTFAGADAAPSGAGDESESLPGP